MRNLLWVLAAGVAIFLLLWAVLAFVVHRELVSLARIRCPSCGVAFGMAAAKNAKQTYSEQCEAERKHAEAKAGGVVLIDFDNKWPIECPRCGNCVSYDLTARSLTSRT